MTYKVYDLFPLSVFKDRIDISSIEKQKIIEFIFNASKESSNTEKSEDEAWLGDVKGQEYLFKNKVMTNLSSLISQKIKLYTEMLGINNDKITFFYQRSWATITKNKERIHPHSHDQSNISFAYYLLKPENSGDIRFLAEPQNEIAKGLFLKEKKDLDVIKNISQRTTPNINLEVKEDEIVIFPSKARHATVTNSTKNPRISISGDITIMLKNSYGHEKLMPHFKNWQEF